MAGSWTPVFKQYIPMVREAAAVVAAILIAFAIDAWWDARGTAEDKREALASLETELQGNLDLLASALRADRQLVNTADAIVMMKPSDAMGVPSDSASILIRSLFHGVTFNPSEGALRSLLATGAIEEIDSRQLRQAIAALSRLSEDLSEEVDQIWMGWQRYVDRGIETGTHSSATALARDTGFQTISSAELLNTYVRDSEFPEIFAEFASIFDWYSRELEDVASEIDRTLSLIQAELQ